MFSKSCEYAIKAVVYLATHAHTDSKISLSEISKAINSPSAYSAKILQKLSAQNIISSVKGNMGGYYIDKNMIDIIYLGDIVDAIDGDAIYTACALGLRECSEKKPCSIHNQIKKIRTDLKAMLGNTTIKSLIT